MLIKRWFTALLTIFVFLVGTGIAYWSLRPPAPPSEKDSEFASYIRMLTNIEAMTKKPHPAGTKELAEVREYLLAEIEEMGLPYQVLSTVCSLDEIVTDNLERKKGNGEKTVVQKGQSLPVMPRSGPSMKESMKENLRKEAAFDDNDSITLHNILVKLDAPDTERGVLFMAHYDSEYGVPGACDDMVSVCALLEAMRRQAGSQVLKNDLYFLFTDGEELGGMGAKVFVRDNPEMINYIDLVVNMDSRGTSGGLLMFETSKLDYLQVKHFKAASSNPISYSWMSMIYRQMSNGTDLTRFLDAGYPALNFAVAEGAENYSSSTDDIYHLNRGTAYNFLINALDLSDYAAANSLKDRGISQDGVYFTLLPGHLVLMSGFAAHLLAAISILAALLWVIIQLRNGKIKLRRILPSAGCLLSLPAAAAFLAQGIVILISRLRLLWRPDKGMQYNIPLLALTSIILGAGVFTAFVILNKKHTFTEILSGMLLLFIPATLFTTFYFNAASYLFSLPLLGIVLVAFLKDRPTIRVLLSCAVGIAALLLYVPLLWLLYISLGYEILPVVVSFSAIPVTLVAALHRCMSWGQVP